MNLITSRLAILAGARPDAIRRARMDIGQSTTIGVVMLITATIAWLTMGYALFRAFTGDRFALPVAVGGGMLWGAFILSVDRLLLLGIDKNARWYRTALQFLLRLPIAVVLGVAISKPVILRVSQSILDRELRRQRIEAVGKERVGHEDVAGLADKNTNARKLENDVHEQQKRVQREPDSYEYKAAQEEEAEAERQYRAISSANNERIARARSQIRALDGSVRPEDRVRVQRLQSSIGAWNAEIRRASADVGRARDHVEEVGRQWVTTENGKLVQLEKERTTALAEQKTATDLVAEETEKSRIQIEDVMKANLVNEYTILRQIEHNPKNPDAGTLKNFELALDFLFILFELTPLLAKMFSKVSPLDHATSSIEEEEKERIGLERLAVIAHLQKLVEISHTINDEALEQWTNARLDDIQQSLPLSTAKLRNIRAEIEKMSA
jgi:hypothetical protein